MHTCIILSAVSEASYGNRPRYSGFKYAAAKVISGGCPYGWHKYNNHCYWFSRQKLNWYRASVSLLLSANPASNIIENI
jgi:hypothetical protein